MSFSTAAPTHIDALTRLGYVLSDRVRTEILLELRNGTAYPADLAQQLGVSRQVMSNQLGCLRGCGLVRAEREGRRVSYSLVSGHLSSALDKLLATTLALDPSCCSTESVCVSGETPTCSCCEAAE